MWIYKDVVRSKLCLTIFLTFTVCLSKFVCVCFCMQDFFLCVSTSVCMHVLLYEFVQKYSMYGCMHACTYAYMYICISLSTYLCVCGYCLSVSIRVYLSFHLPPPPPRSLTCRWPTNRSLQYLPATCWHARRCKMTGEVSSSK